MNIIVRIIEPDQARYKTSGDYFYEGDALVFQIVRQATDFETKLILAHELIEQALTEQKGIAEEEILHFDQEFLLSKREGEPGDAKDSPYYLDHQLATIVERMMCLEAGINFDDYNNNIIEPDN